MNRLQQLQNKLERAEEIVDARKENRDNYLDPILEAIGFNIIGAIRVDEVYINGKQVHINYSWSRRGLVDSDDITVPLAIFEAEDPVKAAKEWDESVKKQKTDRERQNKLEQLKKLQEELLEK